MTANCLPTSRLPLAIIRFRDFFDHSPTLAPGGSYVVGVPRTAVGSLKGVKWSGRVSVTSYPLYPVQTLRVSVMSAVAWRKRRIRRKRLRRLAFGVANLWRLMAKVGESYPIASVIAPSLMLDPVHHIPPGLREQPPQHGPLGNATCAPCGSDCTRRLRHGWCRKRSRCWLHACMLGGMVAPHCEEARTPRLVN